MNEKISTVTATQDAVASRRIRSPQPKPVEQEGGDWETDEEKALTTEPPIGSMQSVAADEVAPTETHLSEGDVLDGIE